MKRAVKTRIKYLMAEWDILRFGLSEREAAEAWAESMALHEDAEPRPAPPSEGLDVERAYILLISATPALYRAHRDSPNEAAKRLNAILHDAVVDWCLDYQKATGRGDQGLVRLASTEPSAAQEPSHD